MIDRLARLAACFLLAISIAGPAAAQSLTLEAGAPYVDARVNGHPVRLRVDPEAPGYILLNPGAVQRVGLRPSMTRARSYIGPVRLTGRTKSTTVTIATRTDERRIIWMDRDTVTDADGIISPADLPYERVTISMREAAAGERVATMAFTFEQSSGLVYRQRIGEQEVAFKIAGNNARTLATAAAGAVIGAAQGGMWAGPASDQPIRYGITRPTRPLALGTPMSVGGLPLSTMLVRTQDDRGNAVLPPENEADPDEMVVTANTGRSRARYVVILGNDWLSRCSSLTWDNGARLMTLSCRP